MSATLTLEVRCKACGSRMIAHEQGYLVRSLVSEWAQDKEGGFLIAASFCGIPRVMWDSDIGGDGYVCMNCDHEFVDLDDEVEIEQVETGPTAAGDAAISVARMIASAFPDGSPSYDLGFRDALESAALALTGRADDRLIADMVQTALDAFSNNV